jgi:hypothetical protein
VSLDSLALLGLFLVLWLGARALKTAARANRDLRDAAANLTRGEGAPTPAAGPPPEIPGDPTATPTPTGGSGNQQTATSSGRP